MKLWLWRRHRRFPRIVARPARPQAVRARPSDGGSRDYDHRIAEALGTVRRAEYRGRTA